MHDLQNTSGLVHATKEKIWKRSFTKTLFKLEEFKNVGFAFSVNRKHLENGPFNNEDVAIITWLPWLSFP